MGFHRAIVATLSMFALCGCEREPLGLSDIESEIDIRVAKRHAQIAAAGNEKNKNGVTVILEYFEVPRMHVNDYLAENPAQTSGDPLRRQVEIWTKTNLANFHDMMAVRGRSGEWIDARAVHEVIYPDAFRNIEVEPNDDDHQVDNKSFIPVIPPIPVEFKTREVGSVLEIKPVINKDGTILLNLDRELTFRQERNTWDVKSESTSHQIQSPVFTTTKVVTEVTVKNGS